MALSNGVSSKRSNNSHKREYLTEEQQEILRTKSSKIEKLQAEISQIAKPLSLAASKEDAQWTNLITPGTLSVFQDEKSWTGISNTEMINPDYPTKDFRHATGMSWSALRETMQLDSEDDSFSESGGTSTTTTTCLDSKDMDVFGMLPMEDNRVIIKCKNCQRPILPSKFKKHLVSCIGDVEGSNSSNIFSDEEDDMPKAKKNAKKLKKKGGAISTAEEDELLRPPSTFLDKATATSEKSKKLKKEKPLKKTAKQKAPLDLDRQCGVIQGPNNLPCTRSLTCKSHSMGAKRAVEGRSQPYDVLLAAYQKKSIGRPNAKERKGTPTVIGSGVTTTSMGGKTAATLKTLKKLHSSHSLNGNNNQNKAKYSVQGSTTQTDEPFIDSDEEVENVMQAIRLSKPTPLAQKPFHFVKRRRQCFRLRDILLDAITPKLEPTLMMGGSSNMNNHGGDGDKVNATESLTDIVTPQFTVQTQHRQPPPDFLYNHQNRLYNSTNNMVENNNVYINPP